MEWLACWNDEKSVYYSSYKQSVYIYTTPIIWTNTYTTNRPTPIKPHRLHILKSCHPTFILNSKKKKKKKKGDGRNANKTNQVEALNTWTKTKPICLGMEERRASNAHKRVGEATTQPYHEPVHKWQETSTGSMQITDFLLGWRIKFHVPSGIFWLYATE